MESVCSHFSAVQPEKNIPQRVYRSNRSIVIVAKEPLRILSWNVFLMHPTSSKSPKKRAEAMVDELLKQEYDILLLQKVFYEPAKKALDSGLKRRFPHRYGPFNPKKCLEIGTTSGLWVASKTPLSLLKAIDFETKAVGVEKHANKGGALLCGEWNGNEFHILNTHLQGGHFNSEKKTEKARETRECQCKELRDKLLGPKKKSGVPQIICGDLSINKGTKPYRTMLNILDAVDGPLSGPRRITADTEKRNDMARSWQERAQTKDYILLRINGAKMSSESIVRSVKIFRNQWTTKHCDLSYRYAVEAEVKL